MLKRNPDLCWNLKKENIKRLVGIQKRLIRTVAERLEQKSRLVYSTCSLEPEENREMMPEFLKHNKSFGLTDFESLEKFRTEKGKYKTIPHRHLCNGAFIAIIEGT